jgi:hypothetical protein
MDERGSRLLQRSERRRSLTRTFYEFEMECRDREIRQALAEDLEREAWRLGRD